MKFEEEFQKYKDDVIRLAYSYLLNLQDSEDVTQKVFMQLYKNINKLNDTVKVKHWLIVTTINYCKSILRSPWRKKIFFSEALENNIFNYDDYENVKGVFSNLSKKERIPLYLNIVYGYTSNEIASLLNVSESSIKMRIKRAREKINMKGNE